MRKKLSRYDRSIGTKHTSGVQRVGESLVIVGYGNEAGDDLTAGEEAAVEALHSRHGDCDRRALHVYVAFWRFRVHVDVNDAAVFEALLDHVVSDLFFPILFCLLPKKSNKKHIKDLNLNYNTNFVILTFLM